MEIKNNVMIICLIMLILLGVTCVSATQDIDTNSTLQTSDSIGEEVISSQNTDDLEAQTTEVGLENDIEEVLEADGNDAVGNQVENDEIENDISDLALDNGDLLGISSEEVLGDSANGNYHGYVIFDPDYNALINWYQDKVPTFVSVNKQLEWNQYCEVPHVFFYGNNNAQLNIYSEGEPMLIKGGPVSMIERLIIRGNPYNVYFVGNDEDSSRPGTLDGRGLSSIAKITRAQTETYFKNIDLINAINGAVIIENFEWEYFEGRNYYPKVVFENCNFKNITGGAVIANDKCNITFKNCNFEDISSDFGAVKAVEGTNIVFENCKFTNVKYKAHVEFVNSANGVLTAAFKQDYPLYIGAVLSDGSVKFTDCEFWDGVEFVKTNDENIREVTFKNKNVHMEFRFENPSSIPFDKNFTTTSSNQFNFDYRNDADFLYAGGEGYNTFTLTFEGDNYVFPFNATGAFETYGGFNYLQNLINNAPENSVINLTRDILYSEVYDSIVNGVVINKNNLTIDGKGHTIDAKGFSRIFKFANDSVRDFTLKNIILINGKTTVYGGAIEFEGYDGTIENVTFRNNSAVDGGAVYFSNNNGKIINCTFDSNHADRNGGAVHFPTYPLMGGATNIQGSVFTSNTAKNGGAIFNLESNSVTLAGNNFTSNKATLGGAIYNDRSSYNTIKESVFSANEATLGGAIYFNVNPMGIDSSNFTLNVAEQGGAIYLSNKDNNDNQVTKDMSISNSYFKDNRANATEIVVINDDRLRQELTVGLKGGENYINAIYAEDGVTVNFDNVSYWAYEYDYWAIKNDNIKSVYAPYVRIDLYALSTNGRTISMYEVSDVTGHATFSYGDASSGYYPLGGLQHNPDSVYTLAQQRVALSVKNLTFTDLQRLIDNTTEGGELILEKDFVYSDVDDAEIKANGGINIGKNITILGQDHIIDAKGQTRMFNVNADNVSISGIIFENGANAEGSVAKFNKGDVKVNDCILINNPGQVFSVGEVTSFDFNDNWFGNDWTNYNVKPDALGDLDVERWYFLNIAVTTSSILMSLNNEYDNSENAVIFVGDDNYGLPFIDFAFNTTSNIQINENVTGNISIAPYNQLTYSVPELSAAYGHPIGITLKYADKSFTKTEIFEPNLHLEGFPDTMIYGNVTDYRVRVVGAFGEVLIYDASNQYKYDRSKYVRFMLSNGKSVVLDHDSRGYYDLKLNSLLNASELGTYNYTLYIEKDMLYNKLNGNFTILPVTTALNIIVEDCYVGQPNNVTVILDSVYGGVYEGLLIVYVDGWPEFITNVNGERVYTFVISNYLTPEVGQHVVNATYVPANSHYLRIEYNESYQVFKYGSKIDVDVPSSITYGEDFTFEVTVDNKTHATFSIVNASGSIVKNGDIDGNEITVNGLACGDYELVITNDETESVYSSALIKEFTVNKIIPKMEVNCAVVGPHVNITVKMTPDVTGNISFNGIIIPIEDGVATFIGEFEQGYHVLDVTYITDKPDIFTPVGKSVSFYTTKLNDDALLNTSIEVIPEIANNNVFLTAKVNPSATGIVAFTINGESFLVPIINGEAVHYAILEAGTYTVLVTYNGDSQFNANSTTATIDVTDKVKQNTTITPKVDINGNNVEITVEVDELATGEVAFTIDGNTYKVDVLFGKSVFNGYFNEGYHAVYIEYLGDDEFEANSTTVSFTVEKALKNTTVGVATKIDERTVELFISLDAETNGFALIDINGTETYVKVDYGFAYYKTVLSPGNYSVNVKYMGDEKFNPAEATKAITVEQPEMKDSNITLDVSVDGNNLFVIIDVPSDATGFVVLFVNDTYTVYDLTGDNYFIAYSAILPVGTYDVVARYSGDETYYSSAANKTVEMVPVLNTTISAKSVVNETTVTVTVEVDSNATGFVEISVAGKKFYVPVVDGVATFENKYDKGTYQATVTYLGDDSFNANTTTVDFTVSVIDPTLKNTTLDVDVSVSGNEVAVTVNVNETATGLVALELGDEVIYLPVNNGKVVYNYSLPIGKYNMSVTYIGDIEFNSNKTNATFEVVEDSPDRNATPSLAKTVIFAPQVTTTYNGNGYLTITVKDENGNLVKSRDVSITINGKTKVVKTDANGVAKLSTNGLAPKTYTASIVFKEDGTYAKSSVTAKVVVKKAASKITAKKKTFKKAKKTKKYKITLKSGKKAIKKVKVTLKIKGKTYTAKTNAKGKAVFKIKKLSKKGKFTAKIRFKGNKYYKAVTKKVKITIK